MGVALSELHIYPIMTAIIFPMALFITYLVAVLLGHTAMNLPYISDTGAYPPESCIFAQFLNFGALLVGVDVYIRYKQIEGYIAEQNLNPNLEKVNQASNFIGWTSALGISIVGNFQETSVLKVHLIGAMMAFCLGSIYMWTQVYLNFKVQSLVQSKCVTYFRLVLAIISSIFCILCVVTGRIAWSQFKGENGLLWDSSQGGWPLHVLSAVSEWLIALSFIFFLLTFVEEFRQFKLNPPPVPPPVPTQNPTSVHRSYRIGETVHQLDETQIENRLFRYAMKK